MSEDREVLLARILALDHEIRTLEGALAAVVEETGAVLALRKIREAARAFLEEVRAAVWATEKVLVSRDDSDPATSAVLADLHNLPIAIANFRRLVDEETKRVYQTSSPDSEDWRHSLSQFEMRMTEHRRTLYDIRREVEGTASLDRAGAGLWRAFSDLQREHTLLLGDSFSLLAGAWTRRMQVDQGVFDVVDRLLKEIGDRLYRAPVAIPADAEISFEGMSAVSLQFADTSVWNLPAVALTNMATSLQDGPNP